MDSRPVFLTVFPDARNVHLGKDVGVIPFLFHRNYGYRSILLTRDNGPYPLLDSDASGLEIEFIDSGRAGHPDRVKKALLDYIKKNAKAINILNLYDISGFGLKLINAYKNRNRHGKVYVKLDRGINYSYSKNPIKMARERIIELGYRKSAFISIESTLAKKFFNEHTFLDPVYVPNGFLGDVNADTKKEKTILFVGDLSVHPKRLDIVFEAFITLCEKKDSSFNLRLVGPTLPDFPELWARASRSATLASRTRICGPIYDKTELEREYRSASVIVLASDHESFGIVLVEAMRFGCLPVVSSGVSSAIDVTDNGRIGRIFEKGSADSLHSALIEALDMLSPETTRNIADFAQANFNWNTIVDKIHSGLSL